MLNLLIKNDELQRKIRGYHYRKDKLYSPIVLYFVEGKKEYLLSAFKWYFDDKNFSVKNINSSYSIDDCLFYGFPIFDKDYYDIMKKVIINLNKNYKNKIRIRNQY